MEFTAFNVIVTNGPDRDQIGGGALRCLKKFPKWSGPFFRILLGLPDVRLTFPRTKLVVCFCHSEVPYLVFENNYGKKVVALVVSGKDA